MTDDIRKYVFDGKLRKRCSELLDGSSDERQMYIAVGLVRFMGKCESGGPCEIPIREEPRDARTLFPDSRGVRKKKGAKKQPTAVGDAQPEADDDDDEGSQAIEDNAHNNGGNGKKKPLVSAEGAQGRRKKTPQELNTFQLRKMSTIVLRDTGRLILPHVGMHIYGYLQRGELRPRVAAATTDYHDYIYDIVTILSFKAAAERPDEAAIIMTLPTPEHLINFDVAQARMHNQLSRLRIDKTSHMGRETYKRKREAMTVSLLNEPEAGEMERVSTAINDAKNWRLFSSLRSLCAFMQGTSNQTRLDCALQSFRGLYGACFNQTLVLFNELVSVHRYRSKLGYMTKVLSLNSAYNASRVISTASFRELLTLTDAVRARKLKQAHCIVFASAMMLLPVWYLQNNQRLLARYEGVYWDWRKENAFTTRMIDYSRLLVPLSPPSEEIRTAVAAQKLHKAIMRQLRTFPQNTMVEIYQMVSSNEYLQAEIGDRHSHVLRNALAFLLGCGALHPVPRRTVERAASFNRLILSYATRPQREAHLEPLLLCTRQQWRISNALVHSLKRLQVRFTAQTSGGFVKPLEDKCTLFIYCATVPRFVGATNSNVAAIHLTTLLGRAQECDNDSQYLVEMMSYDEFVLCDAHLLGEVALLQFFEFMDTHRDMLARAPITLLGDCALPTPFTTLYDNKRVLRDTRTTWPIRDVMQELRHHCALAPIESGSMQRFVKMLAAQKHLNWPHVVASVLALEERRFIVVAKTNKVFLNVLQRFATALIEIVETSRKDRVYTPCESLQSILELACDGDNDLLRSHVLFAAPFVGLVQHRVCLRVEKFYMLRDVPLQHHAVTEAMCVVLRPTARSGRSVYNSVPIETVSLDNGLLMMRVENAFSTTGIDHRLCCGTWDRDVIHVARHRIELVSQSLCSARDALPMDECEYSPLVLFGNEYEFPDVYGALVRATPSLRKKVQLVDCKLEQMPQWLMSHYRKPATFLGDLSKSFV